MAQEWFKFFGSEYLSDPKMLHLSASERSCWLTLLCYASRSEVGGEVEYINEQTLMSQAGVDLSKPEWEETKGVIEKLVKLKMITITDNGKITVCNYRKRQGEALSNYERLKKHREKLKIERDSETSDNGDNENDNALLLSNDNDRVDKNRKEEKRMNTHTQIIKNFFASPENRQAEIDWLLAKGVNARLVRDEIIKFVSYWTEPSKTGKQRWELQPTFEIRRRLATWFSNKK